MAPVNPNLARTQAPPIMAVQQWLRDIPLPEGKPLINLSQAAPALPPPEPLRQAIAEAALSDPGAHLYGPVLGLPELRTEVASRWSAAYGGDVAPGNVAITAGCNQAFCAAIATLAAPGDEVILPSPWYFNHEMWLRMSGIATVPLPAGPELLPDPGRAEALITPRTRAIVLVTPNNPCGVEYPADLVHAFASLARRHKLALILDETYRDFDSRPGRPHGLFADPDWGESLIQLYSFSKAYRLTGHRVGALVAAPARVAEVEKFLDTVTICPNQLGQRAALWGMRNLSQWLAAERAEILARRAAFEDAFARLPGWRLLGCGAYFAYAEHRFELTGPALARRLLCGQSLLALPGTMFTPEGDPDAPSQMRFAFANIGRETIGEAFDRLAAFTP
jgi:aspartate/methionine/tyrosine aminotransferase